MKMKCIKLLALAAIFTPMLLACGGGSDTPLFGSLAEKYGEMQAEQEKFKEEAKAAIEAGADKSEYLKKNGSYCLYARTPSRKLDNDALRHTLDSLIAKRIPFDFNFDHTD